MLIYYFELYMHHNYCLRRKQHSYAACDAALAASDTVKAVWRSVLMNCNNTLFGFLYVWTLMLHF